MKINIDYPEVPKKKIHKDRLRLYFWYFLLAGVAASVIINISVGGKAWSLIVAWSVFTFWKLAIARDMIEYNLIRQTIKPAYYVAVLLVLIQIFLAPDSAEFVVPLVCFGFLVIAAFCFFLNIKRRKSNTMPLIWACFLSLVTFVLALCGVLELNWPMIVLGSTAGGLAVFGFIVFGKDIIYEIKKRFYPGL